LKRKPAKLSISPAEAVKAFEFLRKEERQIKDKVDEFNFLKSEVNDLVEDLYEARKIL